LAEILTWKTASQQSDPVRELTQLTDVRMDRYSRESSLQDRRSRSIVLAEQGCMVTCARKAKLDPAYAGEQAHRPDRTALKLFRTPA
jgi:hypothetical protein